MEGVKDINNILFFAVREGKLEIARQLINSYGLSYSKNWSEGYALLRIALRENHTEVAKLLLASGSKVNSRSLTKTTPLHFAAINGNIEIAKILLDKGANINAKDIKGNTALYYAIEYADVKFSKLLISNRANIKDNPKLLINAINKNMLEIVEALVHYDVDINAFDDCGRTALHFTALNNLRTDFSSYLYTEDQLIDIKAKIARLLLNKGANVNAQTSTGLTSLHIATEAGFLQVVEVLLEYDADVNVCDADGMTALHYTVVNRSLEPITDDKIDVKIEIAKLLLSKGANVNAKTKTGLTVLQAAANRGLLEIVEALLKYNVDINACDVYGVTALHYTVGKRSDRFVRYKNIDVKTEIVKILLRKGANVNAKTQAGLTALHAAARRGLLEAVKTLLEYGADVNVCDVDGITALHYTVGKQNEFIDRDFTYHIIQTKIAKLLIENGADVNAKTLECETALHIAIGNGYIEIANILLKHNANVNCRLLKGKTALHVAAEKGYDEIIDILLDFGADVNSVDEYGRTALYIATVLNRFNIVTTLFNHSPKFNVIHAHSAIYLASFLDLPNYENIDPSDFEDDPDYYPYPKFYNLEEYILNFYKHEVIKLEVANLDVGETNIKLLSRDDMAEYKAQCEKEIANMKLEKIDNSNISFYDILVKNSTVLAKFMRNEKIVKVLKSKKYETKFPEYGKKITCNFRKAMYRKQLQEKGTDILPVYFNNTPELPYDCIEEIVNYLNNDDIKALFDACDHNLEIRWSLT